MPEAPETDAPERCLHEKRATPRSGAKAECLDCGADTDRISADLLAAAGAELHLMKTAGIIEVAVRNPSVKEYMQHWEGRAEKTEARVKELEAELRHYRHEVVETWMANEADATARAEAAETALAQARDDTAVQVAAVLEGAIDAIWREAPGAWRGEDIRRVCRTIRTSAPAGAMVEVEKVRRLVADLREFSKDWRQCGCTDAGCAGRHAERDAVLDDLDEFIDAALAAMEERK